MPDSAPNLVLGAAWRLGVADVRVFVESLRRHYSGDVMLVVSSRESAPLVDYLRSRKIIPVFFDCPYWMVMHIQLARYVRYEEILRGAASEYSRVLLTDVSDVLFQADPFASLPDGELLCFMEAAGRTIGQCHYNTTWIKDIYGPAEFERIKDCEISCSGITIGSHRAIVGYIDRLLTYATPEALAKLSPMRGHDQGIHNFMLRTGALPHARLAPNGQHVFTLGHVPEQQITLTPGGEILAPGGRLCPIIHQYNYKPSIMERICAEYAVREA